jgi:hypothetical protein
VVRCYALQAERVVSQQEGDLVEGEYNPVLRACTMVPQFPLKPEQLRNPAYFYPTSEAFALTTTKYLTRQKNVANGKSKAACR